MRRSANPSGSTADLGSQAWLATAKSIYHAKISTDAPLDEKLAVLSGMKQELYPFEEMCREAKKRLPSQSKKLRSGVGGMKDGFESSWLRYIWEFPKIRGT